VSLERAATDYGVVIDEIDADLCEYEIDYDATDEQRDYIRENREAWLREDPQAVVDQYHDDELDRLDLIRRYGVILDWAEGTLLEETTMEFREMLRQRAVSDWT
jgi:N-methylhydantoinase B